MPFIPFIIGAAVGSAVTYVLKDESSKQVLTDTGGKITGGASALTEKVTSIFKKGEEATEEVVKAEAEDTVSA